MSLLALLAAAPTAWTPLTRAGDPIDDWRYLSAVDLDGTAHQLGAAEQTDAFVLVFMTTECPICRQYVPELNRLSQATDRQRVEFYGVISDASITRHDAVQFRDEYAIDFPVLFDGSSELAAALAPTHVPEAFVLDADGAVVYRGRIDDVYAAVDKRRQQPTRRDLSAAITATLAGEPIDEARTDAVGCLFESPVPAADDAQVTYARDVAPILYAKCVECHRPGEIAPFSLLTYEDAAKRAKYISEVTASRLMPPWQAQIDFGHFLGERRLTEREVALIDTWAKAGAPLGDPNDLPAEPVFVSGWRLGKPDLVLEAQAPIDVPADGPDLFQHYVIPMNLDEDRTLVGFEMHPGNSAVVHHAILFFDTMGAARAKDAETPEVGYQTFGSIGIPVAGILGVWTPGMTPRFLRQGMGLPVPKGADLVLQLHLHPTGKPEADQSTVGLYFTDEPIERRVAPAPFVIGTILIDIEAGDPAHRVEASVTLPVDVTLTAVLPHMHLIGKEMRIEARHPDIGRIPLIWIKDWNFYWQDNYVYREPVHLPAGTELYCESVYDNSAANPLNPSNPPRRVLFGNDSDDEMCFGIFQVVAQNPADERKLGQALRQSFTTQFLESSIAPDAREHIIDEALKLFGGGRGNRSQLLRLLGGANDGS